MKTRSSEMNIAQVIKQSSQVYRSFQIIDHHSILFHFIPFGPFWTTLDHFGSLWTFSFHFIPFHSFLSSQFILVHWRLTRINLRPVLMIQRLCGWMGWDGWLSQVIDLLRAPSVPIILAWNYNKFAESVSERLLQKKLSTKTSSPQKIIKELFAKFVLFYFYQFNQRGGRE